MWSISAAFLESKNSSYYLKRFVNVYLFFLFWNKNCKQFEVRLLIILLILNFFYCHTWPKIIFHLIGIFFTGIIFILIVTEEPRFFIANRILPFNNEKIWTTVGSEALIVECCLWLAFSCLIRPAYEL